MTRLTAILLLSGAMGAALALPLRAETGPATPSDAAPATATAPPAAPPAPASDTAAAARRAADRAALFEAHLAALHAGLTLTPDQDKLWPAVDTAIRGYAKMRDDRDDRRADRAQDRDERGEATSPDQDPVAALKTYSEGLLERAQALKALSESIGPLYAMLGEDQKNRIPMLLRDMAPRRGPVARMVDQLGERDGTMDEERGRGGPRHRWERPRPDEERQGDRDWRRGRAGTDEQADGERPMHRGEGEGGMTTHRRDHDGPPPRHDHDDDDSMD